MIETPAAWPGGLEIRQIGGSRILAGRFPYNSMATVASRGRVRKETMSPHAFRFAIETEPERRIDVLVGHDFGKPVASRQSGTLTIEDGAEAVTFEARLPDDPPSWVVDMEKAVAAGIMVGLSPGFTVPPLSVVSEAEVFEDEPGNPGVKVRRINHAVLRELSVVTSPVYEDAGVDLRAEQFGVEASRRRWRTWL